MPSTTAPAGHDRGVHLGVWLFSIQHRFEGALWVRQSAWNATAASLDSASFLRLPKVLQWFTGNFGFHHIHHLNPRVPNYRLQECHEAVPAPRVCADVGSGGRHSSAAPRAVGRGAWRAGPIR
jgi:hypothetical protein